MTARTAQEFLEELRQRAGRLRDELKATEELEAGVIRYLESTGQVVDHAEIRVSPRAPDVEEKPATQPPEAKPPSVMPKRIDLITAQLREAQEPLTIVQLRDRLRERTGYGVGMTDASLYNSIYTALARNRGLFRRDEDNRWSLTPEGNRATGNGLFREED